MGIYHKTALSFMALLFWIKNSFPASKKTYHISSILKKRMSNYVFGTKWAECLTKFEAGGESVPTLHTFTGFGRQDA